MMKPETKNTIKAEIADLKANLNGQQEKLTHLIDIIDQEETGNTQVKEEQAEGRASSFDFKLDRVSRKDITRDELKSILERMQDLSHAKHPEIEIYITNVESETNEPVTLTTSHIGKGIRFDDTISINDHTKRLVGDFKIEFNEDGIQDISAKYYKAFWNNHKE
ncbi:hypothetical protein [Rufibacter tibetensis]|uniref:Uncharacterized protein n=1 Tax=Rufibacter tibetensis TaxID=512763 RepID=A0A0P0C6I0_9BACT|nr:hypothetical protein [Rufibacter tibetensis]ALJ00847.1 hypothetical protein DC20_19950 [Rufibacter tibetensis]